MTLKIEPSKKLKIRIFEGFRYERENSGIRTMFFLDIVLYLKGFILSLQSSNCIMVTPHWWIGEGGRR